MKLSGSTREVLHLPGCRYLGNDAWDCGHIDQADEQCDCECCARGKRSIDDELFQNLLKECYQNAVKDKIEKVMREHGIGLTVELAGQVLHRLGNGFADHNRPLDAEVLFNNGRRLCKMARELEGI